MRHLFDNDRECYLVPTRFLMFLRPAERLLALSQVIASFGSAERHLTLALIIALLVHLLVIFLVGFDLPKRVQNSPPSLEIILVHRRAPAPVKDPDYLAEVHQQGVGTTAEAVRPANPIPAASQVEPVISAPASASPSITTPSTEPRRSVVVEVRHAPPSVPKAATATPPHRETALSAPPLNTGERHNAAALVASGMEIASLAGELSPDLRSTSRRPRSKYISASTREYKYAAYMEAWRAKVERIGNLNYPTDARRRGIYGSLILDVALGADGGVRDISVVRSSGHKLLDDNAIRIVQLSAPFAPFPPDIRKDTDILHITRTWQFREGNLSSKP
ncbi:periplasmic protein TonB [Gammaproteobacteria bacterium]